MHGQPSGLDNAVCCFGGGALAVRQDGALRRSPLDVPPLALLVVDTKKPRSTRNLVERVAALLRTVDRPVRRIFDAIDAVALDFAQACAEETQRKDSASSSSSVTFPRRVAEWMRLNHSLLRALTVSDPVLEAVADVADHHAAAATKLTGAGGGGCAIVLLHHRDTFQRLDEYRVSQAQKSRGGSAHNSRPFLSLRLGRLERRSHRARQTERPSWDPRRPSVRLVFFFFLRRERPSFEVLTHTTQVRNLVTSLRRRGFDCYRSDLGGDGVQVSTEPLPESPFSAGAPSSSSSRSSRGFPSRTAAALSVLLGGALVVARFRRHPW